jgi:Ca-activated chloride channel family protein
MENLYRMHPISENNQKHITMKTILFSLILLITQSFVILQDEIYVIRGLVSDEQGSPLAGAGIVVKNSNRGTIADQNGEYIISVLPGDKTLVFSLSGYQSREVTIGSRKVINVTLKKEAILSEEQEVKADHMIAAELVRGLGAASHDAAKMSFAGAPVMYDPSYQEFNTEGYSTVHENGYKDVLTQPLSTFSIDVDRASYSNVRRFINMGQLPPVDAVRIEEMINYFSYDYPEPSGQHPFSVITELSECPWNSTHQLLHVGLKGKEMDKSELPASNLVFLIDVSGSMEDPNKLPLLKSAFQMLVSELRPLDRVAIVVYAGAAGMVLASTPGNRKEIILGAINNLQAGGSTAGGEGLRLAYKIAAENIVKGGNNRIVLATDGDFNVGVSSNADMERLVEQEREKGIFITVLGFGMGNYKDDKMEIIADKGNGNYAYIDNIQEARKIMISEFAGTLFTIAKDVKFQLEFNPARVKAYRLIGYENRLLNAEDFNNDRKDAGEMGAGHTVTALYELIPAGSDEQTGDIDPLKYQTNNSTVRPDLSAELLTVKLRYKLPESNNSILINEPVAGKPNDINKTSANFRFAAAVAEFGLILRDSEFKAEASFEHLIGLAQGAREADEEGYRSEFIQLVKTVKDLKALAENQ